MTNHIHHRQFLIDQPAIQFVTNTADDAALIRPTFCNTHQYQFLYKNTVGRISEAPSATGNIQFSNRYFVLSPSPTIRFIANTADDAALIRPTFL